MGCRRHGAIDPDAVFDRDDSTVDRPGLDTRGEGILLRLRGGDKHAHEAR